MSTTAGASSDPPSHRVRTIVIHHFSARHCGIMTAERSIMSYASVALVAAVVAAAGLPQARPARRMTNDARARSIQPLIAATDSPQLIEGFMIAPLMNERDYQTFVEQRGRRNPAFVPIRRKPDGLSARAQYGCDLIPSRRNLSWA